jgi:hypothetical protein
MTTTTQTIKLKKGNTMDKILNGKKTYIGIIGGAITSIIAARGYISPEEAGVLITAFDTLLKVGVVHKVVKKIG